MHCPERQGLPSRPQRPSASKQRAMRCDATWRPIDDVLSSDVRVVRAKVKDAELCFRIARAAAVVGFEHVFPPDLSEFPAEAIRADWISALTNPDGETYIAFEDDEAVGVVSLSEGVLQTLYVVPELWSRGIGSALHDLALDRLRARNVQEARLWTLTENHRARAFYERRGWRLTGRTRVVPHPPHPIDVEYARSIPRG
jgi:RimJ/RimL family protein N-acetyltransferase